MLSNTIASNPNILTADTSFSRAMSEINSLLTVDGGSLCRRSSLQLFFLKQLHQNGMRVFDIRKLCQEGKPLAAINDVFIGHTNHPKAELFSVCELPEYQQVKTAYLKLTKGDEKEMLHFLDLCQDSANHRFALMKILGNMIYIKRAERKLTDKEEQLARWFSEKIQLFKMPMKEVVLRIIGQKDFDHHCMQLSPESSVNDVEIALLILHITCVLTSEVQRENSPLKKYLSDPLKCKQSYILAHGETRIYRAFEERKTDDTPSPITCPCGLRIMFKDDEDENKCPRCKTKLTNQDDDETFVIRPSHSKGYSKTAIKSSKWDARTSNMSPPVYRALHLIVHASLYGGVAMGMSSKTDLSSLLNLTEDSEEFCLDHIRADLTCLMTILCCKEEIAIKVMHVVIEKCTELFRGRVQDKNTFSTSEERHEWEIEFSNVAKDVLPQAFGSGRALKEMIKQDVSVEDKIHEVDSYPSTPKQQDDELKRLFRVTKQPSFEGFQSTFLNTSKEFKEHHGFLSLFFAKFQEFSKIGHLNDLLKWTRLVSSALTHRISRKDAESKSINDFITGHLLDQSRHEDEKKSYQTLFNKFKQAWNDIRNFTKEHSQNKNEMPRLKDSDAIGYCLIESDSGDYLLNAIKILVSLQNSVLDEIIFLSTKQNAALRFLEVNNDCSGTSCISIQEAKGKEIINFHWSDVVLKYAKKNPEYGRGEEISFDFERMEIELANEVAFGKCYLVGSLNKFIFSNEFFHSVGPMLTEVRQLLPKNQDLPDEVRRGLSSVKESRIQDAQNLLQHIEVLIFLIKQRGIAIERDISLEKFVDMMTTSPFPLSLLPEPRNSIKLEHIPALYEALEDLLADGAIEGLPEQFRQDLSEETKEHLKRIMNNGLKSQTLLNALRRFVLRYLSSEKFLPNKDTTLSSCLKEPSLWSPGTPPSDMEIITKEITLEYIYSVITYLQLGIDKSQRNPKRFGVNTHTMTTPKNKPRQKRRLMANFSRS